MLTIYLNSTPCTKFVLVEDSLEHAGKEVLVFLVKNHISKQTSAKIHIFLFENKPLDFLKSFENAQQFIVHDFFSDPKGWLTNTKRSIENELLEITENCIIVIDSLCNVILELGLTNTYRLINKLINHKNVSQIITTLHKDLVLDKANTINYMNNLATLLIDLPVQKPRLTFVHKKQGGKIVKLHEEYWFEGWKLMSGPIKKPHVNDAVKEKLAGAALPERLTTFKIDLESHEKVSRDMLELPYVHKGEGGKIVYDMDEEDDWDEEDPDDDLDI